MKFWEWMVILGSTCVSLYLQSINNKNPITYPPALIEIYNGWNIYEQPNPAGLVTYFGTITLQTGLVTTPNFDTVQKVKDYIDTLPYPTAATAYTAMVKKPYLATRPAYTR